MPWQMPGAVVGAPELPKGWNAHAEFPEELYALAVFAALSSCNASHSHVHPRSVQSVLVTKLLHTAGTSVPYVLLTQYAPEISLTSQPTDKCKRFVYERLLDENGRSDCSQASDPVS